MERNRSWRRRGRWQTPNNQILLFLHIRFRGTCAMHKRIRGWIGNTSLACLLSQDSKMTALLDRLSGNFLCLSTAFSLPLSVLTSAHRELLQRRLYFRRCWIHCLESWLEALVFKPGLIYLQINVLKGLYSLRHTKQESRRYNIIINSTYIWKLKYVKEIMIADM